MILDDPTNDQPTGYQPSERTQNKIRRILADEESQQQRTWSYYARLRKENPTLYWQSQAQMHQDANALGEKFADWPADV